MKYIEFKNLTVEELQKKKGDLNDELFHLRMKNALGQVSNPLKIRQIRRDIARIKTALYEKLVH